MDDIKLWKNTYLSIIDPPNYCPVRWSRNTAQTPAAAVSYSDRGTSYRGTRGSRKRPHLECGHWSTPVSRRDSRHNCTPTPPNPSGFVPTAPSTTPQKPTAQSAPDSATLHYILMLLEISCLITKRNRMYSYSKKESLRVEKEFLWNTQRSKKKRSTHWGCLNLSTTLLSATCGADNPISALRHAEL